MQTFILSPQQESEFPGGTAMLSEKFPDVEDEPAAVTDVVCSQVLCISLFHVHIRPVFSPFNIPVP